jgi:ribosomal-protein-alanine N-acetyltransferase
VTTSVAQRALPVLTGPQVVVRLGSKNDIADIIDYFQRNAAHLSRFAMPLPAVTYEASHWSARLEEAMNEFQQDRSCRLFMFERGNDSCPIGVINFFGFLRGHFHGCILGYHVDAGHEGRGCMYEGLSIAIEYVFNDLNMHRIMSNHAPQNLRSARLLHRLGFRPEGYAREYLMVHGEWQDHVLNALTNRDWRPE